MGQYYDATSLDKLKSANTFDVGEALAKLNNSDNKYEYSSGQKLMEHSWLENHYVKFIMLLLSDGYTYGYNRGNGPWYNNSFGWVGDYADEDGEGPSSDQIKIALARMENTEKSKDLIDRMSEKAGIGYQEVSELYSVEDILSILKDNSPLPQFRYIVNTDKKEIVDLKELELHAKGLDADDVWIIHPLPLLTCVGNGRGGGDFHGEDDRIGMWYRDHIYTTNDISNLTVGKSGGYYLIDAYFTEE